MQQRINLRYILYKAYRRIARAVTILRNAVYRLCCRSVVHYIHGNGPFYVYPQESLSARILAGRHEVNETQVMLKYLKRNDVFIDVGANIGYYTFTAAALVGEEGLVCSIEPATEAIKRLDKTLQKWPSKYANVSIYPNAVSDQPDFVDLIVEDDASSPYNRIEAGSEGRIGALCNCITLDSLVDGIAPKYPDMIKIDVEGYEVKVLMGATKILTMPDAPLLIVEHCEDNLKLYGFSGKELYNILAKYGYKMMHVNHNNRSVSQYTIDAAGPSENIVCIKNMAKFMERTGNYYKVEIVE